MSETPPWIMAEALALFSPAPESVEAIEAALLSVAARVERETREADRHSLCVVWQETVVAMRLRPGSDIEKYAPKVINAHDALPATYQEPKQ